MYRSQVLQDKLEIGTFAYGDYMINLAAFYTAWNWMITNNM